MSTNSNWRVVPKTATACWLGLVAGVLLLAGLVWRMATEGPAILSVVAAVAAALLVVVAVIGLVTPDKRGR
jgi:high-affinity Fe2+/Pb2+ permease